MLNDLLKDGKLDEAIPYSELVSLSHITKIYYGEDWYILLDEKNEILEEFKIERNIQKEEQTYEINEVKENICKGKGLI